MISSRSRSSATASASRRTFLKTVACSSATAMGLGLGRGKAFSREQDASEIVQYPIYRAAGSHRELGRQHGEQAKTHIDAHLSYMRKTLEISTQELESRALQFRPLFEKHCPHLIDEVSGLAEGAGISFAEALAVNIRSALTQAPTNRAGAGENKSPSGDGCTAFAISREGTADGEVLIGQNSDMLPAVVDFGYVLHLKPESKPELLMWTFGGMIGYHGLNSHGVANFANDLGGGPRPRFAMPHYPLKRLILECRTFDEILPLFQRVPLWANGNYVLCDETGRILDVEATTAGAEVISDQGAGFLAHSNHFLSERYATDANHALSAPDSFDRLRRMTELIKSRQGHTTLDDVKTWLRTSDRHAGGICRVAKTPDSTDGWTIAGITVASIIAQPAERTLHVAASNEPDQPFIEYTME